MGAVPPIGTWRPPPVSLQAILCGEFVVRSRLGTKRTTGNTPDCFRVNKTVNSNSWYVAAASRVATPRSLARDGAALAIGAAHPRGVVF